jgi:sugar lactone lactonase YvrE
MLNIGVNARWAQNGITVAGGNGQGAGLNQLFKPEGVYVYDDQTLYVADYDNHRIVEWKDGATNGQVVAGGNECGNGTDQLNHPTDVIVDRTKDCLIICDQDNRRVVRWPRRKGASGQIIISNIDCWGLAMDSNGYLYVSDFQKNEVRRWREGDTSETVVAGGNGNGDRLDQLLRPTYLCIDQNNVVYVSDTDNHRVIKWVKDAKEGIVVAGGKGQGNNLTHLTQPYGIAVDQQGTVYIVDRSNHRVMRWPKGATQGSIIAGGNGEGKQANQFYGAISLSFDRQGNFYVADMYNHRIQKFNIHSS